MTKIKDILTETKVSMHFLTAFVAITDIVGNFATNK